MKISLNLLKLHIRYCRLFFPDTVYSYRVVQKCRVASFFWTTLYTRASNDMGWNRALIHLLHIGVAYFYSLSVFNKSTGSSDVGFERDGRRFWQLRR